MHTRVTSFKGSPDRYDEAVEVLKQQTIPAIQAQKFPGFMGGYWLGDRQSGKGKAVTFFESAEALAGSRAAVQKIREEASQAAQAEIQSVEEYEVFLNTGEKVHRDANAARVITGRVDAARVDQFAQRLRDEVIPKLRDVTGFQGGLWAADRASGKIVGMTLYDTTANLAGSRELAKQMIQETSQAAGVEVADVEEVEVTARAETPAGAAAG
jgi:hypothetical protein